MSDLLEQGCILFNSGKFYEAHEVWEDLWRATADSGLKTCYQGLIQAAVGLHHWSRQNRLGARSQLTKSIRNLQASGVRPADLDVARLADELSRLLSEFPDNVPAGLAIPRLK